VPTAAAAPKSKTKDAAEEEQEFAHTPEPVLELSTLAPDRPTISVDDKMYELAVMDDFGIDEQQALTRDGAEFDALWNSNDELSKADKQRLKMLLDRMFERVVLEMPKTVKAKMKDGLRGQIVMAFTLAPLAAAAAREQAREEAENKAKEETPTTES
jgi:hypothetical protein